MPRIVPVVPQVHVDQHGEQNESRSPAANAGAGNSCGGGGGICKRELPNADVILLGPQVKYEAGRLTAPAAPQGKAVAVIDMAGLRYDARRCGWIKR